MSYPRIKIQTALDALSMEKPQELAVFLGMTRQIGWHWSRHKREYLPEIPARRLLEKRPEFERLDEGRAA